MYKHPLIFGMDNLVVFKKELYEELKKRFPYVSVNHSTLGGDNTVSLLVAVSLQTPDQWAYKIFENSQCAKLIIERDGTVEKISGSKTKLRKFAGKSASDIGKKINERLEVVPEKPFFR
jgi:hypothetical protein